MAFKMLQFDLNMFADPRIREFPSCEAGHAAKAQVQLTMEAAPRTTIADADFVLPGSLIKRRLRFAFPVT